MKKYDVVVVGAGPNGLSAAITMAQAGRSVLVLEANEEIGGAVATSQLTLPGFLHDTFSAVHPLGLGSPFFRSLPLSEHGLEWIHPTTPLAHPFDRGMPALLERSFEATGATLGEDARAYRKLLEPFVRDWEPLTHDALAPPHVPRHPILMARFGIRALQSAQGLASRTFEGAAARALFAGVAAHATVPLRKAATAAFGMVLMTAGHAVGWPIPRGGSGSISRALGSYLRALGGEIVTERRVRSLRDLPPADTVFFNVTALQLLNIIGDRLRAGYRKRLERFRYGTGVFKMDWALSEPIPWKARDCARAGTLHLGGSLEEIAAATERAWSGDLSRNPYVLLAQPSLFDPTRAPDGKHTAWGYCHVPRGSSFDMTDAIENQVERYAPGFRDVILARHTMDPAELEQRNPNLVGGDINGGAAVLGQLFFRPVVRWSPHKIPGEPFFICSASTPPGGGVHGMCGYHAARTALRGGA